MAKVIPGNLKVSNDCIADLAGYAALECYGVVGMAVTDEEQGVTRLLPTTRLSRGVDVSAEDGHLVVDHLLSPVDGVIVLALIHCDGHCTNDIAILFIQIHAPFVDIGTDTFNRRVLPFAPSGVCGHLWRTLRHIIIKGDDGIIVVLCC